MSSTSAQWQQSKAPSGNSVNCLYVLNTNIFAGTAGGGIIMSSDNGANWIAKNSGISNLNIKAISADLNGYIYAGSNSLALYTSIDTGNNWASHTVAGTGTAISAIASYGTNVFLGEVGDGVFLSVNNEISWSEVGLCCASVLSLCSDLNGYVFAGTSTSVYRSSGTFTNWAQMDYGLPGSSVRALVKSDNRIFAGTYGNGVFVTDNDGASWTQVNTGITDLHIISLAANDSKIFAGTDDGGVFSSVDNGLNWIQMNDSLSQLNIPSLAICGSYLYAGTTNGSVWKRPLSEFTMIEEAKSNESIMVYPNPASDIVTIHFDNNIEGIVTLKIFNVFGSLVKSELFTTNQTGIDVSNLINGIYLFEITNNNHLEKRKILIQR